MGIVDIIRAWEDPEYRKSLSPEQRAKLPANPVGEIELTEDELTAIMGGDDSNTSPQGCHANSNQANTCHGSNNCPPPR
jgi:mersacidin/lichenicidin family type 2 lantibiotic